MPCTVYPGSGWPAPWPGTLSIPANIFNGGFLPCSGNGTGFSPTFDSSGFVSYPAPAPTGWQVGARPSAIAVTLSSPAIRTITFAVRDTALVTIGSLTYVCPVGISTATIVMAFGAFNIQDMRITVPAGVQGLNDMPVTSIVVGGITGSFWQGFSGQYEI